MPLSISESSADGHRILLVAGELDLLTAPQLAGAASDLIDSGASDIIVDAKGLEFCDSSGVSAFAGIVNRIRPAGGRLAIACSQPIVRRVFELCGLDEAAIITDDLPHAMAALKS